MGREVRRVVGLRELVATSIAESFGTAPWYDGPEEDLPEDVTYETIQREVEYHFADNVLAVFTKWQRQQPGYLQAINDLREMEQTSVIEGVRGEARRAADYLTDLARANEQAP